MSGKNPDSSDKFIVVDNIGSNSSRQSFKILVGIGSSKQDFVGAIFEGVYTWNFKVSRR